MKITIYACSVCDREFPYMSNCVIHQIQSGCSLTPKPEVIIKAKEIPENATR